MIPAWATGIALPFHRAAEASPMGPPIAGKRNGDGQRQAL